MSCNNSTKELNRSAALFKLYAVFSRAYFWAPLFVLYFSTYISLKQVLLLESIYYASVFILEVPSGYFSDYLGRKRTLLISSVFFCISYFLFFLGGRFSILLIAQIFLAGGFAFASGTDTSLHYSLLSALGKKSEYGERESKITSATLIIAAAAAVVGGVLAWLGEYRTAYAMSFLFAAMLLVFVIIIRDPEFSCVNARKPFPPLKQLIYVFRKARKPSLRYMFIFTIAITVLNHIPYEFYQLYIRNFVNRFSSDLSSSEFTPVMTGFHVAATMLFAAVIARRAAKLKKKTGVKFLLLTGIFIQIIMIVLLNLNTSWITVLLLVLRSSPGAFITPVIREETTSQLPSTLRATYYSMQSLLGRLSFSFVLIFFNLIPGNGYENSLLASLGLGITAFLVFLILPYHSTKKNKGNFSR